jgi:hypothetical protein
MAANRTPADPGMTGSVSSTSKRNAVAIERGSPAVRTIRSLENALRCQSDV